MKFKLDLFAELSEPVKLYPGQSRSINTGVRASVPEGAVGLVILCRSLSNRGLELIPTVLRIEEDAREEIILKLINSNDRGSAPTRIEPGDLLAHLI